MELKIGETLVAVDKGIAEAVERLNALGFRTVSSCSGLREDHRGVHRLEEITSVCVEGRRIELIDIAEASGWDWSLDGKATYSKDGRPKTYMNFSSSQGRVYKITARSKGFKQTLSSKEEAIRSQLPFEFTSLELETEEPKKDEFIKRKIAHLLETIARYAREKSI